MALRGCPWHSLTGQLWLRVASSRGRPRWAGDSGGGLRGASPGAGRGPGAGGAQGCRPRSLHSVGPMLLPGAGIYMVRGGGSCRDKHREVMRVRHRRPQGTGAREGTHVPNTHTHPTPDNTHHTYTHLDTDVHITPHRAPAHTVTQTR